MTAMDPKPFDGPAPGINLKGTIMNIPTSVKVWALDAGIRAVKTFGQALVAEFGASAFNVLHAPWPVFLGTAAGAGLVSVLQNLQSLPEFRQQGNKVVETTAPVA